MNPRPQRSRQGPTDRSQPGRRAAILLAVLICVFLVSVYVSQFAQTAVRQQRLLRHQARQRQAAWLVQSAADRAMTRRLRSPEYQGEAWIISGEELGGVDEALARIRVLEDGSDSPRTIEVTVEYPAKALPRARVTKQFPFHSTE